MSLDDLFEQLSELARNMDASIDGVDESATKTQALIYDLLRRRLDEFTYIDGRLDPTQPFAQKIMKIQREMEYIIGRYYSPRITEYLATFDDVDDVTISLHQSYNELQIKKGLLTSARRTVYDQAEYYLVDGLADAYIQPAKYLLMQAVTDGISLKDAKSLLKNWNEGKLSTGGLLTSNRPTPRLQTYSTQVARDSLYQYNGSIQEVIKNEYGLEKFIYVGGLVKDSRPLCKHLVSLKRKIDIDEVPPLIEKYPQGVIPGTTKKNWAIRRGGFSCQHTVMFVRG